MIWGSGWLDMQSEQLLCKPWQGMVCALLIGSLFFQSLAEAQAPTPATDKDGSATTVQADPKPSDEAAEITDADADAGADANDPSSAVDPATLPASTASMERFDPSEKVSEDKSVSFPVDI